MSDYREPLPLLGDPPRERSDAARNRDAVLAAAVALVEAHGAAEVTMEAVAEAAGVGKATVFRRFESRSGLMAAVLDRLEQQWQAVVIGGPPPLGPGAAPFERLLAFGRSRVELNIERADLIEAATDGTRRSYSAWSFHAQHLRHLFGELEVTGDVPLLVTAVLAPLEPAILRHQVQVERVPVERIVAAWSDLAARVVRRP